jgi:hypothetical protein
VFLQADIWFTPVYYEENTTLITFVSQNYPLLTVFNIFNAVIEDLPIFTYMAMDQYLYIP